MITNIDIDETVVAEEMRLTGARTKRELVDRALREPVACANRPSIRELFGIGGVDPAYDPKAVWATGEQIGQFRVEQPKTAHAAKEPDTSRTGAKAASKSPRKPMTTAVHGHTEHPWRADSASATG